VKSDVQAAAGTYVRARLFTVILEHRAPGEHARLATVDPVEVPEILHRD
jgi:hypothetical protein